MKLIASLLLPLSLSFAIAQEEAPAEPTATVEEVTQTETSGAMEEPAQPGDASAEDEGKGEDSTSSTDEALQKEAEPYLDVTFRHVAMLESLAQCLSTVNNEASANAAAAQVDALTLQVKALMEMEQKLAEPTPEVQELVTGRTESIDLGKLTADSIGKALEILEHDQPCFGSGALFQALTALLSLYLDEEDDEPVPDMAQ